MDQGKVEINKICILNASTAIPFKFNVISLHFFYRLLQDNMALSGF